METKQRRIAPASTITCPRCGHAEAETMSTDACRWSYDCRNCGQILKPKPVDCCVFRSYGNVPWPSVQTGQNAGG